MMTKAKEAEQPAGPAIFSDTTKVALYGEFGTRKTLQIKGLIELVGPDNVLIISAEHGLNTIRSVITKPEMVLPVATLAELRTAWGKAKEFASKDRWLVLDGGSQVTEWIANEQLSGADRYYEAKQLGREPASTDLQYGRFLQRGEINTMACYGKIGRDSENLLSSFIGLPCNLYINYLRDKTGSSGFEKTLPYGPDCPGRVGLKAIMSSFDFVGHVYYNEKGELCAGFDSSSNYYMARTREDRALVEMPKEFINFSLAEFVQLVGGNKTKEAAAN